MARSGLGGRRGFGVIDKLLDLRSFLIDLREMLGALLLVDIKLGLRLVFLADVNVILPEAVVSIGKIGIELKGAKVLRDRFLPFMLVGVEVAELEMRLGQRFVEGDRLLKQRLDGLRDRR